MGDDDIALKAIMAAVGSYAQRAFMEECPTGGIDWPERQHLIATVQDALAYAGTERVIVALLDALSKPSSRVEPRAYALLNEAKAEAATLREKLEVR